VISKPDFDCEKKRIMVDNRNAKLPVDEWMRGSEVRRRELCVDTMTTMIMALVDLI
jgi:hypothetical protein